MHQILMGCRAEYVRYALAATLLATAGAGLAQPLPPPPDPYATPGQPAYGQDVDPYAKLDHAPPPKLQVVVPNTQYIKPRFSVQHPGQPLDRTYVPGPPTAQVLADATQSVLNQCRMEGWQIRLDPDQDTNIVHVELSPTLDAGRGACVQTVLASNDILTDQPPTATAAATPPITDGPPPATSTVVLPLGAGSPAAMAPSGVPIGGATPTAGVKP